jgi:hypothetical protein
MGGRPLYVDGRAHVSSSRPDAAWHITKVAELDSSGLASWRERLTRAAFEEHASIAAFARTLCQLVALGAPAWLVEKTQRALADEVRHATGTFEWVARLGGGPLGPGPLPAAVAPFEGAASPDDLAASLVRDVFRGGCVNETLAAHEAATLAREAPLDDLRAFYETLADDEARHAALAFETILWLVSQTPAAVSALRAERALHAACASDRELIAPLVEAVFGYAE